MLTKTHIVDGGNLVKSMAMELIHTPNQEPSLLEIGFRINLWKVSGFSLTEHSMRELLPTTSQQETEFGNSSMVTLSLETTNKQWFPIKILMTRRSTSNWTIRAMLAFQNLHGKLMLMRSFDSLTLIWSDVVTISDDVLKQNAFHNICMPLALLGSECSTECRPEGVLDLSLHLPELQRSYHTSHSSTIRIHNRCFMY